LSFERSRSFHSLCQECFDKGTRFAKKKSNPSLEVKIDGRTVGSERVLTCEDLKRLKPVPIEKLEVASTWDGEGPAMENGEELLAASGLTDDGAWRTAHKSSLEGLDMFLGRVFDFVLGRLASIFKDEGGDTYPAPLLSLLLELLNESKSPFYRVERAKSLARTISNEMSTLLDGHDTCSSMSRSVLTQLESLVKVLSNLSDSACGRSQPLDLSKKQPHNILCKVHGIPAVRRRCAKPGINRDRRFYVCGLPKGQRCDFFCWADSSECRQVEEQEMASPRERRSPSRNSMESSIGVIIRDSLWNTSTSSGPLHLRLCSLFEDEFGPSEFAENRTGFETFNQPRKTTRKHEFLKDCLYTMQIAKNEYNDGVWCSKEKLQGCVWLRVEGKKSVISDHAFNEITPPEAPVSDPRLIVFESVLDLITRIADHSTAQRWLSLLCDLAITPDSASPRDLAIKALKKFCRGDVILCQAIRDCHAFQFYLKRIISLAADSIALAVLAKEKARQCGSNWSGKAITLAELNAAALVGASVLISEDALTESNRKKIGKALDDLWAIAKKQGHHWRQFCGMSTLPQSFRQMAVSKGNDLREQAFHELLNTPPIVALLWMASCSTGTNQVKLLRLIDFAIYKNHQDQADLSLSDRIWPDHSESAGELKHPEQILVSSDRRMSSLDIVTMTTNLVYEGRSADLRRVAFSVISKLIKEWTLEDEKWAIFRLLFSFITDVGILGKAGVEFLSLLQTLARSLAPREEMRSMGYTAFKAFESQLGIISFNRCNGEWVTIESTTGSKTRRIDLSRCSFCCHQNLNSIRSSFSRTLTKKMRQESARVSTDGENSAKTLLTSNVNPKRKFHRDQVSPFSRHRLDMEKISSEFSLFFKLKYRIAISEIHIAISDPRGRYVKVVNVYCTPRPIQELSELKSDAYAAKWQKVATLRVTSRGLTRISARLMLPVVAANIKLEFAEFYERPGEGTKGADGSTLVLCPRCTNPVTNSHGVCGRCGDAVFQCRRCRHIVSCAISMI
jgi:GRF zinc finger